jgi:hypothetical protein
LKVLKTSENKVATAAKMRELFREDWSNAACCGYAIIAGKSAGLSEGRLRSLLSSLKTAFDAYSVEEAAQKYYDL